MAPLTRRALLKTGMAALPGAALARYGARQNTAHPQPPANAGFPVPARQWHGDSSVAAALRSGPVPAGSPLGAVAQTLARPPVQQYPRFDRETNERILPEGFARVRQPSRIDVLRATFPNLRRHFVFEYYPWYETDPDFHWGDKGHTPPYHIASTMMPALGPYPSRNMAVIEQHARWMAEAGVGAIAISWWGVDSLTNMATPMIMDVMRAHDIHVTFHLEPYRTDRALYYASDINYLLREYGERRNWDCFLLLDRADGSAAPVFKTFRTIVPTTVVDCQGNVQTVPDYTADSIWRQQTDALRENVRPLFDRIVLLADSLDVGRTAAGGFDGIAIYDAFVRPTTWAQAAADFGGNNLLYSFAVNCGFDGFIPVIPNGVCDLPQPFEPPVGPIDWQSAASRMLAEAASRERIIESLSTTLDVQVDPALGNAARGFFLSYITTFNEWHEGTSFEPAKDRANLLPEERPFNYHNPENGAWRIELLQSLLDPIVKGR